MFFARSPCSVVCVLLFLLLCSSSLRAETVFYQGQSQGTGWAVSSQHIVTNYHVVEGYKDVLIVDTNKEEFYGLVISKDKQNDIAVIRLVNKNKALNTVFAIAKNPPRIGEDVFTIGFPHANIMGTSAKMTRGTINAASGLADDVRMYQISVPLQPGNSGGPLLNMRGELVGITTGKLNAAQMVEWTGSIPENVNYAIKAYYIHPVLESAKLFLKHDSASSNKLIKTSLPDVVEKLVNGVFIIYPGQFKELKSSAKNMLANSHNLLALPESNFNQVVELGFWDGVWKGDRDKGLVGDCALMQEQSLKAKINDGYIELMQTNADFNSRSFVGHITKEGELYVDKGDTYFDVPYLYTGYFDGKTMVGTWKNGDCKGKWAMKKK